MTGFDQLHLAAHRMHLQLAEFLRAAHAETAPDRIEQIAKMLHDVEVDLQAHHCAIVDRADRLHAARTVFAPPAATAPRPLPNPIESKAVAPRRAASHLGAVEAV